jgi:hypothetical protein
MSYFFSFDRWCWESNPLKQHNAGTTKKNTQPFFEMQCKVCSDHPVNLDFIRNTVRNERGIIAIVPLG